MGEDGCADCRERVDQLWALAAEEGLTELPEDWETRCSRHRTDPDQRG